MISGNQTYGVRMERKAHAAHRGFALIRMIWVGILLVLCTVGISIAPVMAGDCSVKVSFDQDGVSFADLGLASDVVIGFYRIGDYSEDAGYTINTDLQHILTADVLEQKTIDDDVMESLERAVLAHGYTVDDGYTATVDRLGTGVGECTGMEQGVYLGRMISGPDEFGMLPFLVTLISSVDVHPKWELVTFAEVQKIWDDNNNQDNKRQSVFVTLYARYNDQPVEEKEAVQIYTHIELSEANDYYFKVPKPLNKYGRKKTRSGLIVYTWDEDAVPDYYEKTSVTDDMNNVEGGEANLWRSEITNYHKPEETEREIHKVWDDNNNQDGKRPPELEVTLKGYAADPATPVFDKTYTLNEKNQWSAKEENLAVYNAGTEIEYVWAENLDPESEYSQKDKPAISEDGKSWTFTNKHTPGKVSVPVRKVWTDAQNQDGYRPESIDVTLYKINDGKETEVRTETLNESNRWYAIAEDLDEYTDQKLNTYEWRENEYPNQNKYTTTHQTGEGSNLQLIINEHTPETVDKKIWKIWEDDENAGNTRPESITVRLDNYGTVTLTETGKSINAATGEETELADQPWYAEVVNLPKFANGQEINYTWFEPDSYQGYAFGKATQDRINPDQTTITNTALKGSLNITKTVTVTGAEPAGEYLNVADGTYVFNITGGPENYYSGTARITVTNGKAEAPAEIGNLLPGTYTIKEDLAASTYTVKNNENWDMMLVNRSGGQLVDADGIQVTVTAGAEATVPTAAFTNDALTDTSGNLGSLAITKNVTVNGSATTTKEADGTYTFIVNGGPNKATTRTVTVTIEDGKASTAVEHDLPVGTYTVTEAVPEGAEVTKIEGGTKLGKNSVTVEVVADGTAEVKTVAFTNDITKVPDKTTISGTKAWEDESNLHKTRPALADFKLILKANGTVVDSKTYKITWTDTDKDTWKYTIADLPAKDSEGKIITYTVEEESVKYYKLKTITDTTKEVNPYDLTNELTPGGSPKYLTINGTKTWADSGNATKKRPNKITVTLYQQLFDEEPVVYKDAKGVEAVRTVTAATGWQYSFQNLPESDGYGNKYKYTVRETGTEGYTQTITGYNIKNSLKPGNSVPPTRGSSTPPPSYSSRTEEELEDLADILDYDTPLYGGLLGTGDRTPIYPFIFAAVGAAALIILLVFGRKRRKA